MALVNKTQVTRIGTTENLPNSSTYDILLVKADEGYPVGQIQFAFPDTPRKITGIQKVAQVFMKILFTQKGSDVIRFNQGTIFPELCIGANRTVNDPTFKAKVVTAVKDAEGQAKAALSSLFKDTDSQLDKIIINSIVVDKESLTMYLQLVTRAGTVASIAIPFPELDMKLANA